MKDFFKQFSNQFSFESERQLINAILQENERKLETYLGILYPKLLTKVIKIVIKNSGNYADAEDLTAESVMIFLDRVKQGSYTYQKGKLIPYILMICRNQWRKKLNKRKSKPTFSFDGERDSDADENIMPYDDEFTIQEKREQIETIETILREKLALLKPNEAAILMATKVKGIKIKDLYKHYEWAKEMKEGSLKNLSARSQKKLRELLLKDETFLVLSNLSLPIDDDLYKLLVRLALVEKGDYTKEKLPYKAIRKQFKLLEEQEQDVLLATEAYQMTFKKVGKYFAWAKEKAIVVLEQLQVSGKTKFKTLLSTDKYFLRFLDSKQQANETIKETLPKAANA